MNVYIGTSGELKNAYIGEVYEYSYDFRNKTSTQLANDGWTFTEGGSTYTCDSNGIRITSNSYALRIWKDIPRSLANAKKVTFKRTTIIPASSSTRLSLSSAKPSTASNSAVIANTNDNRQELYVGGTGYTYSGLSSGTYTQTAVLDLVNKTATLSCTGKSDHTETITNAQVTEIRNHKYINGHIRPNSNLYTYIQSIGLTVEF